MGLAASVKGDNANDVGTFDIDSILTTKNADFYEFRISNEQELKKEELSTDSSSKSNNNSSKKTNLGELPALEPAN